MNNICLILFGLMLVCDVFAKHNEWYCKVADDKFQICRKCKDLNEDCDTKPRTECKCENWKFANFDCKLFLSLMQCTHLNILWTKWNINRSFSSLLSKASWFSDYNSDWSFDSSLLATFLGLTGRCNYPFLTRILTVFIIHK